MSENVYEGDSSTTTTEKYLFRALKSHGRLQQNIGKSIFLLAIRDYLSQTITLSELGGIAYDIYYELNDPSYLDLYWDTELSGLLALTADIDFFIQQSHAGDSDSEKILKKTNELLKQYAKGNI